MSGIDHEELLKRLQAIAKKAKDDNSIVRSGDEEEEPEGANPDPEELMADELARVRKARALIIKTSKFKVGDAIKWKEGLRNMNHPGYERPAIVMEVLDKPVELEAEPTSASYGMKLTLKILVAVDDKSMYEFLVDGRRFELIKE